MNTPFTTQDWINYIRTLETQNPVVPFYSNESPFSNFYPCRFKFTIPTQIDNVTGTRQFDEMEFTSSEHAFMACKAAHFRAYDMINQIVHAATPTAAKRLGRLVPNFNEQEWNRVRIIYMIRVLRAKFTSSEELKNELKRTGKLVLVEASPRDRIWGVGLGVTNPKIANPLYWRGTNYLGFALMRVRETL